MSELDALTAELDLSIVQGDWSRFPQARALQNRRKSLFVFQGRFLEECRSRIQQLDLLESKKDQTLMGRFLASGELPAPHSSHTGGR
jgi:hypothetical protein